MPSVTSPHDHAVAQAASVRFLLLGDVGVGKSSFVETFIALLPNVCSVKSSEELFSVVDQGDPPTPLKMSTVRVTTGPILANSNKGSDPLGLIPPRIRVPGRHISFVTFPGYSSTTSPSAVFSHTDSFLNTQLESVSSLFSSTIPAQVLAWFLITGTGALADQSPPTVAFYFVLYELKPIDLLYMKLIHERVNLVPILAKSDTVSEKQVLRLKRRMQKQLQESGIKVHNLGLESGTAEAQTRGSVPFAVSTGRDPRYKQQWWPQERWGLNTPGLTHRSELAQLVQMCVYERFREAQEDAARKVIAWRRAFVPEFATETRLSTRTNATAKTQQTQELPTLEPPMQTGPPAPEAAPIPIAAEAAPVPAQPQVSETNPVYTPPPPSASTHLMEQDPLASIYGGILADAALVLAPRAQIHPLTPSPSVESFRSVPSVPAHQGVYGPSISPAVPNGTGASSPTSLSASNSTSSTSTGSSLQSSTTGLAIPPSLTTNPVSNYVPSTTYTPSKRTASHVRRTLIQQTTGMSVDSSTRPNEIMDQDTMKNVHPQLMEAVAEEAAALDETLGETVALPDAESNTVGSEFKVEIPNSGMTYHPPAVADMVYSTTAMASTTALHTQLQSPVILQGGFPTHGAFVVPTSDIYQAATAVLSATALTATNGEPAIIATGALDSLALSKDIWQAAEQGDLETLRLHLDHGASPNNRNASRSTLLHRTAWQSTRPYDVMELLIRKGANVNLANDNGNTVMQNVLMKHDDPSLLKLLLDAGADTSITNKEGMNSLEVGVLFNRIEGVKFLLENDAESCSRESVLAALKRAKGEEKKTVRSMLNKCLGKEGEKRRSELILKAQADAVLASTVVSTSHYRGHSMQPSTSSTQGLQSQVHLLQNTSTVSLEGYRGKQSHEMDASESSKEGSVVHEDSASASSGLSIPPKNSSRFKLMRAAGPSMTNLFGRK